MVNAATSTKRALPHRHAPKLYDQRRHIDAKGAVLSTEDLVEIGEQTGRAAGVRGGGPVDGRKRRWRQHKIDRREELVDGTLNAIRARGSQAGMDEIATEIGVSKTVLYRYFADKNDLVHATMQRFIETTLLPRVYGAISLDADEYQLVRAAMTEYVGTVDDDPEVYRFIMSNSAGDKSSLAEFERLFAEVVTAVLIDRAGAKGVRTDGAMLWSYVLVGGIQLATHWWTTTDKAMPRQDVIDYLTMMAWSAIEGIARAGGSPEYFSAQPHALPEIPTLPS